MLAEEVSLRRCRDGNAKAVGEVRNRVVRVIEGKFEGELKSRVEGVVFTSDFFL